MRTPVTVMTPQRDNPRFLTRTILGRLIPSEHSIFVLLFLLAMSFVTIPFVGGTAMQTREAAATNRCQRLTHALSADPGSARLPDSGVTREVWMQALSLDRQGRLESGSVRCTVKSAWSKTDADRAPS